MMIARIFYARTWGEMGNQLAAFALAKQIDRIEGWRAACSAIEDIVPMFNLIGNQIREATTFAVDPKDRSRRYMHIMDRLASDVFKQDFERAGMPGKADEAISALAADLGGNMPTLAIGTKGVISRLLVGARIRNGARYPVLNHVTNHGLLELPIHRACSADLHTVQIAEAVQAVSINCCAKPSDIFILGAITAADDLAQALVDRPPSDISGTAAPGTSDIAATASIAILSNRGGNAYLEIAEKLATSPVANCLDVVFIDATDPGSVSDFNLLASGRGLRWRGYGRMAQDTYLSEVSSLSKARNAYLVCKPGPNTIMEALRLGVQCVVLDSGLPMETWVSNYLQERGVGFAEDSPVQLVERLEKLAVAPPDHGLHDRITSLRDEIFDSVTTRRRLCRALSTALQLSDNGLCNAAN